jgi:N-acetylmuramoyl-L-alanine amidase
MIAWLLAVQLAAVQATAPALVIRDARRVTRVPTVASAHGPLVKLSALSPMLELSLHHDSTSWYTAEIWGTRLQLEAGAPMVRIGETVRPLAASPEVRGGQLYVPLQLVSEIFPDAVPNTRWDAVASQLVVFAASGASETPPRRPASSGGSSAPAPARAKSGRRTVIVDAGHGGVDNGMTGPIGGGPRIYEKNITLAVAKKLGAQLAARGVNVVYTRTTDTLIALDDRGKIANRAQGDLFISIHVNAANPNWKDPGGARGFETYFLSEAHTEDARRVEQMENDAARFETASSSLSSDDPLSFILSDMRQNEHLRESSELADDIQAKLRTMHPGPSRGVKQAGFRVLVTAHMPAVLVEIGFGTNPSEARYISNPDKQDALAAAISDAAIDYLNGYEARVRGTRAGENPR